MVDDVEDPFLLHQSLAHEQAVTLVVHCVVMSEILVKLVDDDIKRRRHLVLRRWILIMYGLVVVHRWVISSRPYLVSQQDRETATLKNEKK